ncbi:hypothetical protein ACFOLJ_31275 [Rugamonas sp. CCM 8940]|uniref:hypothetical protein n=1 Tax=Rugamonas sp. CCM 8940 TaxID=2765359 RepID=UPI00360D9518
MLQADQDERAVGQAGAAVHGIVLHDVKLHLCGPGLGADTRQRRDGAGDGGLEGGDIGAGVTLASMARTVAAGLMPT